MSDTHKINFSIVVSTIGMAILAAIIAVDGATSQTTAASIEKPLVASATETGNE